MTSPVDLLGLPFPALVSLLAEGGWGTGTARAVFRAIHRPGPPGLEAALAEAGLPPKVVAWLGAGARLVPATIVSSVDSGDATTRKHLVRLEDGETIETVVMRYQGRTTACISTQAGCAMGCVFCATGQGGFRRHLLAGEILAQVRLAAATALELGGTLRNLVFMGMGEPLHNFEAVNASLHVLVDNRGWGFAPSRVTVSTVGHVPGMARLAAESPAINLAVSLHGATDASRDRLVPVGRRWPLAELMRACRDYQGATGRRIFFEWTLIAGGNDSPDHAREVATLLAGLDAHLNVIPLNPTAGYAGAPSDTRAVEAFQAVLREAGIPSTVRQRRGIDVAAGCGQLRRASLGA